MYKKIVIKNGKKYIVNCCGWDDGVWNPDTTPVTSSVEFRVIENGDSRLIEDGDFRILDV